MQEYDGRAEDEDPVREMILANPLPLDAQRMGLDRNTEEGALVAMAASLNGAKPSHRLIAWVLLLVFVGPLLLGVLHEIF